MGVVLRYTRRALITACSHTGSNISLQLILLPVAVHCFLAIILIFSDARTRRRGTVHKASHACVYCC